VEAAICGLTVVVASSWRRRVSVAMERFRSAWMVRASSIISMPQVSQVYLPILVMYPAAIDRLTT